MIPRTTKRHIANMTKSNSEYISSVILTLILREMLTFEKKIKPGNVVCANAATGNTERRCENKDNRGNNTKQKEGRAGAKFSQSELQTVDRQEKVSALNIIRLVCKAWN